MTEEAGTTDNPGNGVSGITIRNLSKSFGATRVIDGVSFAVGGGTFLVLVGPSGCGKSTLLRMIAGLEEADSGEILIGERDVTGLPPKQRDIAMVFQNYALYPHMTVLQNMGFSLRLAGVGAEGLRRAVVPVCETLGLADLVHRYPRQLSGGQRQRVAMGRAIVRKPVLFLFDEPLSNLDAKLRVAMRTEIKALHQRLGNTIVYVTHDQVEAMTMADRIAVMNAGRVAQIGTPLELFDDPADSFVAGFIGSPAMNFLPGRLSGGAVEIDAAGRLPVTPDMAGLEGRRVLCAIRPHLFALAPGGLAGTVEVVEPTGAETLVHARIGEVKATLVFRERIAVRPGDRISVAAAPGALLFFDPDSGARLRAGSR